MTHLSLSTHLTLMTLEKKLKAIKATTFLNLEAIESSHNEGVYVTVGNPGKPSFLPLLIFDWRTLSRRVTARW